ncbi:gluconokinase [Parapedobacter indicus]|uniref:Gluconate kinase, FGGY family n=1 Tax=Parapedobacter indicus TaxID=1477437 RepID=A0A1I3UD85_9SPHI|nr:gluconokinase [Parapedobacter indicus]PPK99214.1 gluconate kinase (FGGY family) [Parapedobacter indicus]SFJ79836.1 gluconate kinase, FGGY family [Parapedobacter indicus]
MNYILGVDIGTSGTKAVAFRVEGEVIAGQHVGYPILNPQPGYFEQSPAVLFSAVIEAISTTVQSVRNRFSQAKLLGVGFSSAMHGLIAIDKEHQPMTDCIIWADTRSEPFASKLKASSIGFDIYSKTGTPIHPMSPLCKLGWMREHLPEVFNTVYKFISIKEYVFFKLFGRYVIDESIASATGLFDIHTFTWYRPALNLIGISPEQLAEPVPITYVISGMDEQTAHEMGIPVDTPFVIGGSDGCMANLGSYAISPGDAAVTIGTSGAVRITSNVPVTDEKARTFSYVLTRNTFVLGGAVNSGGVVLQWYKDNFGMPDASNVDSYATLAEEATSVPAGAEGLIFLPYLAGERAPHWNADAKGLFFGVQMHHSRAHFTRAVFEGVIYGLYSVGKVLGEIAGPIQVIHASGGFARAPLWVQLLADVFNKQVIVHDHVEGAATGAYMTVVKALGILNGFGGFEDGSVKTIYTPDAGIHRLYMENFSRFERLYDKVKDEF